MISFINKFVSSLSDEELKYLTDAVTVERDRRYVAANGGFAGMTVSEYEQKLCADGRLIDAIKSFRARNPGVMLKTAKDIVEDWRSKNLKWAVDLGPTGKWVPIGSTRK